VGRNTKEARKEFDRARELLEVLVDERPRGREFRSDLAAVLLNLSLTRSPKQSEEALADLDASLRHLQSVLKQDPPSAKATALLPRVLHRRALILNNLKRYSEAAGAWERYTRVAPAAKRTMTRTRRAWSLARSGRPTQAMAEIAALVRTAKLSCGDRYDLACVAAVSASAVAADRGCPLPRREHLAESWARQAVAWLVEAHKADYFKDARNRAEMKKDTDFDGLRGREDFKRFMKKLPKD